MRFSRLLHCTLLFSAITFAGCAQDDAPAPDSTPTSQAGAVRTGYVRLAKDGQFHPVTFTDVNGQGMLEGDIVLGPTDELTSATPGSPRRVSAMGVAISGSGYRWPGGVVPYFIDPSLPNRERVTNAIAHWEARTNLRFVQINSFNSSQYFNRVVFRPGDGCSSPVGMQGGPQHVNLASGCWTSETIHEIG
ncbi:MAG TPA: M12 family metallopeptidase, partial [Archangium sp.]|uniref:M12 family metallopeptidase n=1 Tax=Archangium sp. TaxID=1872627 RepID=UPI002ED8CF35